MPLHRPTTTSPQDTAYAWQRLLISVIVSAIGSIGMWGIILYLPAVQAGFEVDRGTASLAYTGTMAGFAFGNFVFGRYVDRFGAFWVLLVAALVESAGFFLLAVLDNFTAFVIVQAVMIGAPTSVIFAPLMADISHWFLKRRGIAISIIASGNYLAGTVWPHFLNFTVGEADWRVVFSVIGAVILLGMTPLVFLLRRRPPFQTGAKGLADPVTRRSSLSPRALTILLALAGIGCCVAMSMPQVHIVALCTDLGYGAAAGGQMLSLMLAGGIVSRVISGWLSDHIGGVYTLLIGSSLQCLALFLYIPFDGLASLYVVSLVFGLSQGGIVPSYAIIVREYLPAEVAGERVGLVIFATVVGMAFGGWLSGWIFDATLSYQAAFINGIVWNFANIAIIALILLKTRTPNADKSHRPAPI